MNTAPVRIVEDERVWSRPDGADLLAKIYRPDSAETDMPVVVDVHGGVWSLGDRTTNAVYHRGLAETGVIVVAIDFRDGRSASHPAASIDVTNAVRWARLHASEWGGGGDSIGLVGSSSGGHLAMLSAVQPGAAQGPATLISCPDGSMRERPDVDGSVCYVVALWPVSDPYYRYRYAVRANLTRLVEGTASYFPDETAMRAASVPRIVVAGEAEQLPPLLVVQPGEDSNVPVEMTFDLLRAWQSRAGHVEYAYFPGMPHAFGARPSPVTDDMIRLVRDFIDRYAVRTAQTPPVVSDAVRA